MENLNKDIKTPFGDQNMNLSAADENLETESKIQEPKTGEDLVKSLREKYKTTGGKAYEVKVSFNEDDDEEKTYDFIFKRPNTASYDRYVKTSAASTSKALKMFLLDNICLEQEKIWKKHWKNIRLCQLVSAKSFLICLGLARIHR